MYTNKCVYINKILVSAERHHACIARGRDQSEEIHQSVPTLVKRSPGHHRKADRQKSQRFHYNGDMGSDRKRYNASKE